MIDEWLIAVPEQSGVVVGGNKMHFSSVVVDDDDDRAESVRLRRNNHSMIRIDDEAQVAGTMTVLRRRRIRMQSFARRRPLTLTMTTLAPATLITFVAS